MKKTWVAMLCKMNYHKCLLYLNWMERLDLIKKEDGIDDFELVNITDNGREIFLRQLADLGYPGQTSFI